MKRPCLNGSCKHGKVLANKCHLETMNNKYRLSASCHEEASTHGNRDQNTGDYFVFLSTCIVLFLWKHEVIMKEIRR